MRLLVIRPQPGADATARRLRLAGHEAVVMPLFAVQPVAWIPPLPDQYDALLLTSGNAVRAAGQKLDSLRGLPVLAVGAATARAASELNLAVAATGNSGVQGILRTAQQLGYRRLLWLAGEDRTAVSVPAEISLDTRIVYRSAELSAPDCFSDNVNAVDAIMLHSRRAAEYFGRLCDGQSVDRATLSLAALSPNILESAGSGWKTIGTAPEPNDASLLSQLESCFTNIASDP